MGFWAHSRALLAMRPETQPPLSTRPSDQQQPFLLHTARSSFFVATFSVSLHGARYYARCQAGCLSSRDPQSWEESEERHKTKLSKSGIRPGNQSAELGRQILWGCHIACARACVCVCVCVCVCESRSLNTSILTPFPPFPKVLL